MGAVALRRVRRGLLLHGLNTEENRIGGLEEAYHEVFVFRLTAPSFRWGESGPNRSPTKDHRGRHRRHQIGASQRTTEEDIEDIK